MTDNFELSEREKFYVIGLIISNGGKISYEKLVNIILRFRSPFYELDKKYIRYRVVKKTIDSLLSKKYISEMEKEEYIISDLIKHKFIEQHLEDFIEVLSVFSNYRNQYHLEFDIAELEESILDSKWSEVVPSDAVYEIKQAIKIYNKTDSYDSVILKCGKVMEILVTKVNKEYKLIDFKPNMTVGAIIRKFMEENQ